MKQMLIYIFFILFINGCASSSSLKTQELENMNFTDTDVFDKTLLESMSVNTQNIDINMIGKISVNKIPERLGRWLSVINEEGQLTLKRTAVAAAADEQKTTKSVGMVLGLLPTVYGFFKKKLTYGAAVQYDATIFYHPGTGLIKRVNFTKKKK
jgi:hypothetical protein